MNKYIFWEFREGVKYKKIEVVNSYDNKLLGIYSHPKYIIGKFFTSFTKFFENDEEAINFAKEYVKN